MGRRIPRDEEVLAATLRVLASRRVVSTQRELRERVERTLRKRDPDYVVSGERVRVLAVRSGYVDLSIAVREDGSTPILETCPVCRGELDRVRNRTLDGRDIALGYRCRWCPWWTGRTLRVPARYTFAAAEDSAEDGSRVEALRTS